MKLIVNSLCLLLISITAIQAQGGFAPLGAKWTYSVRELVPPETAGPFTLKVVDIDSFQGKLCSHIQVPFSSFGPWITEEMYLYEQHDSVFYWSPYSQNFHLLYDFTAGPGDSWVIGGLDVPDPDLWEDSLRVTIDSIHQLVIGGDTLKQMFHTLSVVNFDFNTFDWGTFIIEGIGSNCYMIPSFSFYEIGIAQLRCYSDTDDEYFFVPFPCDTVITGIIGLENQEPDKEFRLYPNPVDASLHIRSDLEEIMAEIFFYDMQGTLVFRKKQLLPGNIDLSDLFPGIYSCVIQHKMHRSTPKRIAKL